MVGKEVQVSTNKFLLGSSDLNMLNQESIKIQPTSTNAILSRDAGEVLVCGPKFYGHPVRNNNDKFEVIFSGICINVETTVGWLGSMMFQDIIGYSCKY